MAHVNPIQIQKYLKGVDYPASKAALLERAKNQGADEEICASLEQLPEQDFHTPADVSQAFGRMKGEAPGGREAAGRLGAPEGEERQAPEQEAGIAQFVAQALEDSLAEVELCEMALQKTANDEVKMFAQHMIDAHSKMGREIERMAAKNKLALPGDMESGHKKAAEDMEKLSGEEFDRRFIAYNVQEHEKDIKVFRHYAEQNDKAVRAMAEKGVKMLEQHLKMAQEIRQKLGG